MRRNALVLFVVLSAWVCSGYAQPAAADSFVGDWHSIGQPDDLSRVVIERTGATLTIRIWSQCLPRDCYWGTSAAQVAAGGNSLSAVFSRPEAELTEEFVLLTDGSVQVTVRGDVDAHPSYLTKTDPEDFLSRLPPLIPPEGVPKPSIEPPAINPASLHCTFLIDPAAIAFDTTGGDAEVAVHTPLGCPWTSESDVPWLTVTAGLSWSGEGKVVLHAAANPGGPRAGTVVIGSALLSANQNGGDRLWEIPALAFGPDYWSVVRITNPSTQSRPVNIEAYRASGDRLRIKPAFNIQPRETLEVVLEPRQVEIYRRGLDSPRVLETSLGGVMPAEAWGWVRIAQAHADGIPDLEVRAFVEVLKDNKITEVEKPHQEPRTLRSTTILASEVRGRMIYFLNVSDYATTVAFCASDKVQRDPCKKKDSSATPLLVKPNQFIVISLKSFSQKYLYVESSRPGRAFLAKFVSADGITKEFTAESSISFGGP